MPEITLDQPLGTDVVFIQKGAVYSVMTDCRDQELLAMAACCDIVTRYCPDDKARHRVMQYLWDRFSG